MIHICEHIGRLLTQQQISTQVSSKHEKKMTPESHPFSSPYNNHRWTVHPADL